MQRDQPAQRRHQRPLAAYIQDSWEILPNLTLNAGVRWEQQIGYVAGFLQNTTAPDTGEKIPEVGFQLDNLIAPRVGFIYDPTQEGKAKLFGHWGRFSETNQLDPNINTVITRNLNYGKLNARQTPLTGQLGFRLTF